MNGLILILSLIVIGYIYQTQNEVTKYKITKIPAHHLYYKSAIIGFYFFLSSALILLVFLFLFSNISYEFEKNLLDNIFSIIDNLPDLKVYWVLSFLISLVVSLIVIYAKNKYLLRGLNKKNDINEIYALTLSDPLDKLLNDSAFLSQERFLDKIVMLTMSDKKVYVGTVLADADIFNRFMYGSTDFIFCPIYSGYRDKDSLEVVFTTDYLKNKSSTNKQFQIILNRNNIISSTKVDLDTLLAFTGNDEFLSKLKELKYNNYPILINMKNKSIYIGYIVDSLDKINAIKDIDFLTLKLKFQMILEKDKINVKQYYDFSVNIDDIYIKVNFKEVESIMYRNNPDKIWIESDRINADMLLKMFNYKLIDVK